MAWRLPASITSTHALASARCSWPTSATIERYDGFVRDNLSWLGHWDFELADVVAPVHLFYGGVDAMVPADNGEWLTERLPNATLWIKPDAGHGEVVSDWARSCLPTSTGLDDAGGPRRPRHRRLRMDEPHPIRSAGSFPRTRVSDSPAGVRGEANADHRGRGPATVPVTLDPGRRWGIDTNDHVVQPLVFGRHLYGSTVAAWTDQCPLPHGVSAAAHGGQVPRRSVPVERVGHACPESGGDDADLVQEPVQEVVVGLGADVQRAGVGDCPNSGRDLFGGAVRDERHLLGRLGASDGVERTG